MRTNGADELSIVVNIGIIYLHWSVEDQANQ